MPDFRQATILKQLQKTQDRLDEIRSQQIELENEEKKLRQYKMNISKDCNHKNPDGSSAVGYVGPGYDGCKICGEWF